MTMKFTGMAAFALVLVTSLAINAAPGDLDTTFGNGGIADSTIGGYSVGPETILTQPDGKILVGGVLYDDGDNYYSSFLARYHPNGTIDTSFGVNGVILPLPYGGVYTSSDVALQPDGKIVAVGFGYSKFGGGFAVNRYNENGTPDDSFGSEGLVITVGVGSSADAASSVAIQADGKIVVAGYGHSFPGDTRAFGVVRYNANGSLDTSFNGTGRVITILGDGSSAASILIQPDGKLVVLGNASDGIYDNFGLARYNVDGTLDSSFGAGGTVIHAVIPNDNTTLRDAALQSDGRIIAVGNGYATNVRSAIARYDPNGSIDTSFAQNGIFTTEKYFNVGNSIALQPDGKVLAFGFGGFVDGFGLTRLNTNGTVDVGFGVNGRVLTPNYRIIGAGAVQSNGRILAVGGGYATNIVEIVRYHGVFPAPFDFDGDLRADLSVFRPSDQVWYLNRSTEGFYAVQFGLSTDKISPADYDGDGETDIAVFRDGTWYWLESSTNSFRSVRFGQGGDIPVPADYTGDGRDEIAVYRYGFWSALDLSNYQFNTTNFGLSNDKPVPADYDGDGKVDQAVYRGNGEWYLNRSAQGFAAVYFGLATDKPVPADYDGDGLTDIAVFRPSDGNWYIRRSSDDAVSATNWGLATDIPVPGDYDGDGSADIAVYREGFWYILQSSNGSITAQHFGLSSDIPVASANAQ